MILKSTALLIHKHVYTVYEKKTTVSIINMLLNWMKMLSHSIPHLKYLVPLEWIGAEHDGVVVPSGTYSGTTVVFYCYTFTTTQTKAMRHICNKSND